MTVQQLGQYLFDLGFFLGFFHSAELLSLSAFFTTLGIGLESGQGSFPVKVGDAAQVGKYITGIGFIFAYFPFLQAAAAFVTQLGAELAGGVGSFGPIRVGNFGISGVVVSNGDGSDTITFTIAEWPAAKVA